MSCKKVESGDHIPPDRWPGPAWESSPSTSRPTSGPEDTDLTKGQDTVIKDEGGEEEVKDEAKPTKLISVNSS